MLSSWLCWLKASVLDLNSVYMVPTCIRSDLVLPLPINAKTIVSTILMKISFLLIHLQIDSSKWMWELMGKKKNKDNSNLFQKVRWEMLVFHTLWSIISPELPILLLCPWLFPHLGIPGSLLTLHGHNSSFACHELREANDWSPTFHFLGPFSYLSYTVRERTGKSVIWEQHPQGKAEMSG